MCVCVLLVCFHNICVWISLTTTMTMSMWTSTSTSTTNDDDDLLKFSLDPVIYYLLLVLSPTCRLLYPILSIRWWVRWYQFGCLNLVLQRLRVIVMLPNLQHPSMHCTSGDAATTQYRLMAAEDRPVPVFLLLMNRERERERGININLHFSQANMQRASERMSDWVGWMKHSLRIFWSVRLNQ